MKLGIHAVEMSLLVYFNNYFQSLQYHQHLIINLRKLHLHLFIHDLLKHVKVVFNTDIDIHIVLLQRDRLINVKMLVAIKDMYDNKDLEIIVMLLY
jgi:hypothetical protein